ncbi:MAG TPA: extracellular solute-binding protein [Marmoricola sp.]|nr:extracellular solute-binding protein [Marmoricola sp.]
MSTSRRRTAAAAAVVASLSLVVTGCGAGSKTASKTATQVECDYTAPSGETKVNVLAYNSSSVDPYTNTMVSSCTKGDVTVNHEPIDFGGQVQKTTATLAGDKGTYDIIETYSFVIPQLAADGKLEPLDELVEKYSDEYGLDAINENMSEAMSYDGKLYGLPMQAQMLIMAYREDVFDKLGLEPPTTFEEMRSAAEKIQAETDIEYPIALPLLASADIVTAYDAALGSLGMNLTDPDTMTANLDTPESAKALEALISLKPYMDPQVTTFDQPAVQQQMYNGDAAMSIMFSGRMNDLTLESNSQFAQDMAFAAPPSVDGGDVLYNTVSVDGWSIPANTPLDKEMLFEMIASSVSEKASKASLPAAYPARDGMVTESSMPFAAAANESISKVPPSEPYPWTAEISNAITPIVASVLVGKTPVEEGTQKMQAAAEKILAEYK